MKSGCLDHLLTLWDLAITNLHKQHSPIATGKIFYCLPQLQITESKKDFVCDYSPKSPSPIHQQLENSKLQKHQHSAFCLPPPPLLFNRRFNISNIEEQIIFSLPGKRSWIVGVGLWLVNHYAIKISLSGQIYNTIYIKSNSCSKILLSLHSSEVMQHDFGLEFYILSLE